MARQATVAITSKWRESASMIMLAKDIPDIGFDYKALLFKRHETASFMPNSYVFPGGIREAADESPQWLHHFRDFGVSPEALKAFSKVQGPRPPIFKMRSDEHCLQREISLRITAIRETFEEVGILLCRDRKTLSSPNLSDYGSLCEDFHREHWQHLVHNNPNKFLLLCQELDVVPDLWSLHEWSAWLTPSSFKKRFETAFFLVALSHIPSLVLEKNEVEDCAWKSPSNYLTAYQQRKIGLPPPQFYELSRLLNITKIDELRKFAAERASLGSTLILPVWYKCTDGSVSIMPGDEMYPIDPHEPKEVIETGVSMEEFRSKAKTINRTEFTKGHNGAKLYFNIPMPNGHLSPVALHMQNHL